MTFNFYTIVYSVRDLHGTKCHTPEKFLSPETIIQDATMGPEPRHSISRRARRLENSLPKKTVLKLA